MRHTETFVLASLHGIDWESSFEDGSLAMDGMAEAAYAEFEMSFSTAGNRVTRVDLTIADAEDAKRI